jgi:hypothetical protein
VKSRQPARQLACPTLPSFGRRAAGMAGGDPLLIH